MPLKAALNQRRPIGPRGRRARRARAPGSRLVEHEVDRLQEYRHRRLLLLGDPLLEVDERHAQNSRELLRASAGFSCFLQGPAVNAGGHWCSSPLGAPCENAQWSPMRDPPTIAARSEEHT